MNNDRKVALLTKQLERANRELTSLKSENQVLQRENKHLRESLDSAHAAIEQLNEDMIQRREAHIACLNELTELKAQFKNAVYELNSLKKQYKRRMETFFKNIKNN